MSSRLLASSLVVAMVMAIAPDPAAAQSSKLIQAFDKNQDGKVSRDEIPEGATRNFYDKFIEKYKLDPKKVYSLQELQEAAGLTVAPRSGSSGSLPGSMPRGGGSRLGAPRRDYDGRPYRPLQDLPDSFRTYDKDGDGQIGLYEWPRDRIRDFLQLDRNDDGFITLRELKPSSNQEGGSGQEKKEEEKKEAEVKSEPEK